MVIRFKLQSAEFLFNLIKEFIKNNKINNHWHSLNILATNASTVGSLDLKIINDKNNMFNNLQNNNFEIIYLGQDNLVFKKMNL